MRIRRYQGLDREQVIELWKEVFGYTAAHNEPGFAIDQKMQLQPELFFVAEAGGRVAGTVMGGYDGHRGWIYSLAVAPAFRRRSIGTSLMRHVEQALTELGCAKINLQLLAGNAATVAFYQTLGYCVEERINMGKALV